MVNVNDFVNAPKERTLVFSRILNAPRELVYQAWTETEHLLHWWGPDGFNNTFIAMNVEPGGKWKFTMHGPDGTDYPNHIEYIEVLKNEKLAYFHGDAKAENPILFYVTVLFENWEGKTKLTMSMVFPTIEELKRVVENFGAIDGNRQTLNKLEIYLESINAKKSFAISKSFQAPLKLVFDAYSKAEHLVHWWGPAGMGIKVAHLDFRPGGKFHYCLTGPDGNEMWGMFEYLEIDAPHRMAFINYFSDKDGNATRHPMAPNWPLKVFNIVSFSEKDNITTLSIHGGPIQATADEIAMYESAFANMEQGFAGTFMQLENYLKTIV